jgi:glucokinase
MSSDFLLADIGGTNVRFAVLRGDGRIERHEAWLTALYPDIGSAVRAYVELTACRRRSDQAHQLHVVDFDD